MRVLRLNRREIAEKKGNLVESKRQDGKWITFSWQLECM